MSSIKLLDYDLITTEDVEEIHRRENEEDYKKLAQETAQLVDITKSISELIDDGGQQLDEIDETVTNTSDVMDDININLEEAHKNKINSLLIKGTAIGVGVGFAVGGIAGGIVGSYLGSIGVGFLVGSIPLGGLGGGATYGIIKNKAKSSE